MADVEFDTSSFACGEVVPMPTFVPVSITFELLKENVAPFHLGRKLVVRLVMVEEPSLPLKRFQSEEERYPFWPLPATWIESVLLEKRSGEETLALVTAPVPLPERMPPKVVEAVPPFATPKVPVR